MRTPDFENLLMVLNKEKPNRRTLFEFSIAPSILAQAMGTSVIPTDDTALRQWRTEAFKKLGYDFACHMASGFSFNKADQGHKSTLSLNGGAVVTDWESFEKYKWNEPEDYRSVIDEIKLPDGMKIIVFSPDGVLENTIRIMGYDNLCFALFENEELVQTLFDNVGERLYRYYASVVQNEKVGALFINDDLGFNTQTFLSPEHLRKYVFPWHKKYVELAHREGKPAILHACGRLFDVYDDIINVQKFDGKHSYEDSIQPVEEAYKMLNPKIAVLGGIDVDYLCKSTPEQIRERCNNIFDLTSQNGGYALGTGNSVPNYIPYKNYRAMVDTINE